MSMCHIVCAGPCERLGIELEEGDMLIAADGGYATCVDAGLAPDLFVGDLDSIAPELAESIDCERIELPCEKDDTDTIAACREGLSRGYDEFVLHAALGGDVGHELANIQTLAFLRSHGASGALEGNGQCVLLVAPEDELTRFETEPRMRVSVFAFGGTARGVTLRGLHWELEDVELSCDMPVGVSNYAESGTFEIGVRKGQLLVVIG